MDRSTSEKFSSIDSLLNGVKSSLWSERLELSNMDPLIKMIVAKISEARQFRFEVVLLAVLSCFSTYMQGAKIDAGPKRQQNSALLWSLIISPTGTNKVRYRSGPCISR